MPSAINRPLRRVRLVSQFGQLDAIDVATDTAIPQVAEIQIQYTAGDPVGQFILKFADGTKELVDCEPIVIGR